jgi:hypothetical protein
MMNASHCPALFHSSLPPCPSAVDGNRCTVERCDDAHRVLEAMQLIRLGARASLVSLLTGLARKTVKRMYREYQGRPSPAGQLPFSDAWLLENDQRHGHAMLIWHLYRRLNRPACSPARLLIDVFEVYTGLARTLRLDLARTAFIIQLFAAGLWTEHQCGFCQLSFPAPAERNQTICPSCRCYFRYRCPHCGASQSGKDKGVRGRVCNQCGGVMSRMDNRENNGM